MVPGYDAGPHVLRHPTVRYATCVPVTIAIIISLFSVLSAVHTMIESCTGMWRDCSKSLKAHLLLCEQSCWPPVLRGVCRVHVSFALFSCMVVWCVSGVIYRSDMRMHCPMCRLLHATFSPRSESPTLINFLLCQLLLALCFLCGLQASG